jgi:predicted dehydrogenase
MNIALVGTGYIAGRHAAVLAADKRIHIVGHVDTTIAGATAASKTWGGNGYDSVEALLANEQVDAAWICVPPFAHGNIEHAFIGRGIPLYIEKPVSADLQTAEKIHMAVQASNTLVAVGYYWRCLEVMPRLQQLLMETPPRLIRAAWHGSTPPASWWQRQSQSGGQVVEQATHLVDLLGFLFGPATVLSSVAGHTARQEFPGLDVATVSTATLQFAANVPAVLTATCLLDTTTNAEVEFYCEGRKITLDRQTLSVTTSEGTDSQPVGEDPLALADRKFISAVQSGDAAELPCSYADALETQKLCIAISDAAQKESK